MNSDTAAPPHRSPHAGQLSTASPAKSLAVSLAVVIPTRNRPEMLVRAVESALAETTVLQQVIVVDEASRQPAADVLAGLGDSRLQVIRHSQCLGVSAARNRGVQAAQADVVVFLDDDDQFTAGALNAIAAAFAANAELGWVWGGRCWRQPDGKVVRTEKLGDHEVAPQSVSNPSMLVAARATSSASLSVRREVFTALGGFDPALSVSEDRDLVYRLCANGIRGRRLGQVLVTHTVHEGMRLSTHGDYTRQMASERRVIDKNRAFLLQYPEVYATHLHRVASKQRHAGDWAGARASVREILRVRQTDWKAWRRWLTWAEFGLAGRRRHAD